MRTLIFLLALLFNTETNAQKPNRMTIGDTGCSFLARCNTEFKLEYSSDSSKVYSGECVINTTAGDALTYGIICVQFKTPFEDLTLAEDMMIAYADYLKQNFTIIKAAGYSKGYRLNKSDSTRGIGDTWDDSEKDKWKIRAWTNGKFLGFMYVYSRKPVADATAEQFFNGFRFAK